jgi:hypothetical protein
VKQLLRCRDLCREYGVRSFEPRVLLLLGEAYQRRGWHARAREAWQEGLAVTELVENPSAVGGLAFNLGKDRSRAGDGIAARELFARAAEAFAAAGEPFNRSGALHQLALTRWRTGDRDGADAAWADAFTSLQDAGDQALAEQDRRLIEAVRETLLGPGNEVAAAVALLAGNAMEGLGGEVGRSAWTGLGRLLGLVRRKLTREPTGMAALGRLESGQIEPADLVVLVELLRFHAERDRQFATALRELVSEASADPAGARFLTVVRDDARVGKLVTIERVDGDVTF